MINNFIYNLLAFCIFCFRVYLNLLSTFFVCLFVCLFWDRVSLCSPGWPKTHSVDLAGLKFSDLPTSAPWMLGLKMWYPLHPAMLPTFNCIEKCFCCWVVWIPYMIPYEFWILTFCHGCVNCQSFVRACAWRLVPVVHCSLLACSSALKLLFCFLLVVL